MVSDPHDDGRPVAPETAGPLTDFWALVLLVVVVLSMLFAARSAFPQTVLYGKTDAGLSFPILLDGAGALIISDAGFVQ